MLMLNPIISTAIEKLLIIKNLKALKFDFSKS